MLSGSKKNKKKTATVKGVVSSDVKDYGKDPFFIKKAEASKKVIEKYGLPKQFSTGSK
jgi:hypothetical protein